MYCYLIVIHSLSTCDCLYLNTLNTPFTWCNILYVDTYSKLVYVVVCISIFCVGKLVSPPPPLNSLNHVRICASTLYSALNDFQKQARVIAKFLCCSKKIWSMYEIVQNRGNS